MTTVRTFSEVPSFNARDQFEETIKKKIEGESKEYILGVDEEEYRAFLIEEFKLELLTIYEESEKIDKPVIRKEETRSYRGELYMTDVYYCTIHYTFSGSTVLFKIRPSSWTMTSYEITTRDNSLSFTFKIYEQDPEKFQIEKRDAFKKAFTNMANVNQFANEWNASVKGIVDKIFSQTKTKFLKENDFFAAINVSTNNKTDSIFTVPSVKKIDIPQPKVDGKIEFASIPTMSQKMYSDIIKVVYDAGKSMEQKPSLYKEKDEEGLRDQFLFILETRYVGVTASGETFNKNGKTDILLKYSSDNSNLFVAECKFWKGASEFSKAIYQLFDRYLTWRDSKIALIFFVTNSDFSKVLQTVKEESARHKYFKSNNGENGESSFSFVFQLPNDRDKNVYLEIMLFHYDQ